MLHGCNIVKYYLQFKIIFLKYIILNIFSQNVPTRWPPECSCYLSDGFVLFLKPNNRLFHMHGEIL